jgi:SAM-dependent methyltransferase
MANRVVTGGVASAADHYDTLLAEHYTWMSGDFSAKVTEQRSLLASLGLSPSGSKRALDLGCGSGFQSVALAELGYRVMALDTSAKLIAELTERKGSLPITATVADIRSALTTVTPGLAVAVCMGDTLTHLPSRNDVQALFADVRQVLELGGKFILSFRDLTTELKGVDRFIPVRGDADRVMTCFLEYEPDAVVVHDLIHVREGEGWTLRKSSYRKLRLGTSWVAARLGQRGFTVQRAEVVGGMSVVVAERTSP